MRYSIWLSLCVIFIVLCACGSIETPESSIAIVPEQSNTYLPNPDKSTQKVESPHTPQSSSFKVIPQVYDRFVLTENGQVYAYFPDSESGAMAPVLQEEEDVFCLQRYYSEDQYEGNMLYYQNISAQFIDGGIHGYSVLAGYTWAIRHMFVGYMWSNKDRVDGMRWYNWRYCLSPDGVLYTYDRLDAYQESGDLISIAEGVAKAEIGMYAPGQYYLLYLTNEGSLYFFAETDGGTKHQYLADRVRDFDISGFSNNVDPDILFLQRDDEVLSYGRYWDRADSGAITANDIISGIQAVIALPDAQYPQKVRWFAVAENACTVLGNDGTIAYSDWHLVFQNIELNTDGLVSASVFHQKTFHENIEVILSSHLLALYEHGEILCKEIK